MAIIEESSNVIISSGLVKYHPKTDEERIWIFLLLASKYGDAYFKKWFVIASTMLHMRNDFFEDFKIPTIDARIKAKYVTPLIEAFRQKSNAFILIKNVRAKVEESFTNENVDLSII